MAISRSDELRRLVINHVASALRKGGEDKFIKRLEQTGSEGKQQSLDVLTIIERSPGLPAKFHRLVATAKKAINGDESLIDKLIELANDSRK